MYRVTWVSKFFLTWFWANTSLSLSLSLSLHCVCWFCSSVYVFVLFFGLVSFSFALIPPGCLNPTASFCWVKNFAVSTKYRRHTNADTKKDGTWEGLQKPGNRGSTAIRLTYLHNLRYVCNKVVLLLLLLLLLLALRPNVGHGLHIF